MRENKFVDVSKYGFAVEPRYYFFGWSKSSKILGRKSAVLALVRAKKSLPKGYNFKIWDMQRPLAVQIRMIKSFERRFKALHPSWNRTKISKMVLKFAAKPVPRVVRPDTHRNGGAVDLTIVDPQGRELYMGTDHDDLTERAATIYFESKKRLVAEEKIAKINRRLLIRVMKSAGWENYAPEWWHWSYDK